MKRNLSAIAADLARLEASEFDSAPQGRGPELLESLCDELRLGHAPQDVAPLLIRLMERLDEADLGSPGPAVHTLERLGGYESCLHESLARNPTWRTVWMANRIINAHRGDEVAWIRALEHVLANPQASARAREQARQFLERQREA